MNDQKKYLPPAAGNVPAAPGLPPELAADLAAFRLYLTTERGLAKNSVLAYGRDLDRFARWVAAGGLADYLRPTLPELLNYLEHMRAGGLKASSAGRAVAALKGLYRFFHIEGRTACPNADLLESPTIEERLPQCLSVEQVVKLIEAPGPRNRFPKRDRALLEALYASGCRISELLGVRLDDLLDDGWVRVRGKGSKERLAPLGRPAQAALREYLATERPHLAWLAPPGTTHVFLGQKGALKRGMAFRLVREYARRVGLSLHPHSLRHAAATHMLAGGGDLHVIQEVLGHSKITTTQKYTHLDMARLQEAHRKFHPRGE